MNRYPLPRPCLTCDQFDKSGDSPKCGVTQKYVSVHVQERACPAGKWQIAGPRDLYGPTLPPDVRLRMYQNQLWADLHRVCLAELLTPEWLIIFFGRIPCGPCKEEWKGVLRNLPPVYGPGAFEWSVLAHNEVNSRLGKELLTLEQAREAWPTL